MRIKNNWLSIVICMIMRNFRQRPMFFILVKYRTWWAFTFKADKSAGEYFEHSYISRKKTFPKKKYALYLKMYSFLHLMQKKKKKTLLDFSFLIFCVNFFISKKKILWKINLELSWAGNIE